MQLHCSLRHLEDVQLDGDFQIMWKITDFKSKLRMSKEGERPSVYSPAFHTHDKGYSMGLSLCPYGDGEGKDKSDQNNNNNYEISGCNSFWININLYVFQRCSR